MVDENGFYAAVEHPHSLGAKYMTRKTSAYRPAHLARAIKFSSKAKIDLLTINGARGGTGMSPWRMMNEWGIPTVYLQCLTYQCVNASRPRDNIPPAIAIAGGFSLADHLFKAIALGAPYVKAVCLVRAILTAGMVAKNQGKKGLRHGLGRDRDQTNTGVGFQGPSDRTSEPQQLVLLQAMANIFRATPAISGSLQ